MSETCYWTQDKHDPHIWRTESADPSYGCDFEEIMECSSPSEMGWEYCHYCGCRIFETKVNENEES